MTKTFVIVSCEDTTGESRRIIVRAGVAVERGRDPSPFVLPECEALAAQQRWQDG